MPQNLDCGCELSSADQGTHHVLSIRFCRVHVAAPSLLAACKQVSFYARINHGDKCKDYGEVVDPAIKAAGHKTGEL